MKKTPIYVDAVQFAALSQNEVTSSLSALPYGSCHDFLLSNSTSGIAAAISLGNKRCGTDHPKGVRRNLTVTLTDIGTQAVVATRTLPVRMSKNEPYTDLFVEFRAGDVPFQHSHSYELEVFDANELLAHERITTYNEDILGDPDDWYTVTRGGIRPDYNSDTLYRSVRVDQWRELYVRYYLRCDLGDKTPSELPELEVRIYHPGHVQPMVRFVKPKPCKDDPESLYVDVLFHAYDWKYEGPLYTEIVSMQYAIGGFVFSTRGPEAEGEWRANDLVALDEYSPQAAEARFDEFDLMLDEFIDSQRDLIPLSPEPEPETTDDSEPDAIEALKNLTGLATVKEKITRYEKLVRFNSMRSNSGLTAVSTPLHAMFLGSPGTGKTTVAKLMGKMLHRAGVLSKGHVVVRERATLLGQYYSSEGENTLKAIEEAQGGILFIDEAYQLFQPHDAKDPGKFVIESLLTALADESNRDWMLILAGYTDHMRPMFEMNPGFKSRIPDSNIYQFDDFTEPELMEIAENYFSANDYTLAPDARMALRRRLCEDYAHRDASFGNARHVINMIQTDIIPAMAVRVIDSQGSLTEVQAIDIPVAPASLKQSRPRIGYCA